MDWLSFIASVVRSLAWPLTALSIILVFRRQLIRLLHHRIRVKYKNLELEFGRQIAKARVEIEALAASPRLAKTMSQPPQRQVYFETLAEVSPRAALLEAWLPFEITASRLGEQLHIVTPGHSVQLPRLIESLAHEGLLTHDEVRGVARLRALRNEAVHAPSVDLSPKAVAEYAALLQDVTESLERRAKARE